MVILRFSQIFICLLAMDVALSSIPTGVSEVNNVLDSKVNNATMNIPIFGTKKVETRRKAKKKMHRSTSSDSKEKKGSSHSGSGESLSLSYDSSDSFTDKSKRKHRSSEPKSTVERKGWRKWHRKCTKCPEDMALKWRDPRVKWICGAYQRARRSFKSLCMMHYRNCQDGTMFTKIADHRCNNDTDQMTLPHGDHFFYDYRVRLFDVSEKSNSKSSSTELDESSGTFS